MLFGSLCGLNSYPSLISAAAAARENIGPIIEDFKFQIILGRMEKIILMKKSRRRCILRSDGPFHLLLLLILLFTPTTLVQRCLRAERHTGRKIKNYNHWFSNKTHLISAHLQMFTTIIYTDDIPLNCEQLNTDILNISNRSLIVGFIIITGGSILK